MITYDETKRQINLARHGIDFNDCVSVFDLPMLTQEDDCLPYGETRLTSLGILHGRVVVMIWTERDNSARLISCRYGDKDETKHYLKAFQ
jgi:uncharacterized DUF497 family protein